MAAVVADPRAAFLAEARARHGEIHPCAGRNLEQGFISQGGRLQFWFNDATGNTRMIQAAPDSNPSLPEPPFSY